MCDNFVKYCNGDAIYDKYTKRLVPILALVSMLSHKNKEQLEGTKDGFTLLLQNRYVHL